MFKRLFVLGFLVALCVPSFASAQTCTPDSPCDINLWQIFSDHRGDWIIDTGARFNELYPQFNVIVENPGNYNQIVEQYTLAQEQGNPPAIAQLFDAALEFAADSGFFKYADDIIAGREEVLGQVVDFDDIIPVVTNYYTIDGKWASVAWNTSTSISYANMDLLRSVGFDSVPTTWGELEAICEALQPMVDAGDLTGCASWPFDNWFTEQWLAQMNQYLVNNENGRAARATEVLLQTDEIISIADFYKEMFEKDYYVYTGTRQDWTGSLQLFREGSVAFALSSSASARGLTESAEATGFELGTGLLIRNDDYEWAGNILGGATMWITDGLEPEVEEGALAFLLFLNNTENSASHHTASGYVPIRTSSVELLQNLPADNRIFWDIDSKSRVAIDAANWYEVNPNFLTPSIQLGESTVNNATAGAKFGTFVESRPIIEASMEDIMINSKDAATVFASTNEQLNTLLEEYNFLYE